MSRKIFCLVSVLSAMLVLGSTVAYAQQQTPGQIVKFGPGSPPPLQDSIIIEDSSGNIGIGTTTPAALLDVAGGNVNLDDSTATTGNILKGGVPFIHNFGADNTFIGKNAGNLTTSGFGNNTAIGDSALQSNTTGSNNTASGVGALFSNTAGSRNTASGAFALFSNTTGSNNTAIGAAAGVSAGNLSNATAIGANAVVSQSDSLVLGSNTKVGIGTSSPSQALHISSIAFSTDVQLDNTSTGGLNWAISSVGDIAGRVGNFEIKRPFVDIMFSITQDGAVGIGTTAPDQLLSVNGNASKIGGGAWANFSDERLKTIHGSFDAGLNEVLKLRPIRYKYNKDNPLHIRDESEHIGLSAQEVQRVIPEAVTENSKGYLMLNNDPVLWAMLNAIKDQQTVIEGLKKRASEIDGLRAQLGALGELRAQVSKLQSLLQTVLAQVRQ